MPFPLQMLLNMTFSSVWCANAKIITKIAEVSGLSMAGDFLVHVQSAPLKCMKLWIPLAYQRGFHAD